MAQKDKVKELVGRGLNSYHTKALQQMDRIEKKNKEQNHKISILSNELDNDYLTKTEEGSVVSLEHSKEGMVYLDELQGNTLVNYCTDGSKEITLNGDIDVEGVDNVYNVIIKPNTLYTVALDTNKTGTIRINLGGAEVTTTNNVAMITTPETLTDNTLKLYGTNIKCSKVRLLEGDKTNWIPSYFEGMKSSFEDKFNTTDNTYKMEILSNNRNLLNSKLALHGTDRVTHETPIYFQKGHTYTFAIEGLANALGNNSIQIFLMEHAGYPYPTTDGEEGVVQLISNWQRQDKYTFIPTRSGYFYIQTRGSQDIVISMPNAVVVEGTNVVYEENKFNKIQFSSIEPLRGVGNYKDKFIFKDNKLMIERNCRQVNMSELNFAGDTSNVMQCLYIHKSKPMAISNIFSNSKNYSSTTKGQMFVQERGGNLTYLWIPTDSMSREEFTRFLNEKNATMVYVMSEPTYEEIPYELQKIILEGYENGTLFIDTNIPPTSTVTYAGETPIVKSVRLNKTEVLNNTEDINDNIIPYLMDMDYRVVMLQLATEELEGGVSMARLFGGTYEMIKRDILSKRLTREEYGYRLADYFNAGKLTEEQVRELEELR